MRVRVLKLLGTLTFEPTNFSKINKLKKIPICYHFSSKKNSKGKMIDEGTIICYLCDTFIRFFVHNTAQYKMPIQSNLFYFKKIY
jgi:hypothetical protein